MHLVSGSSGNPIDPEQWMARYNPPDNEAPAAIGAGGVIGRSAEVAVMLTGLLRYSNGLQIELAIRRRLDPPPGDRLHESMDAGLLVGVELADGRAVVAGHDVWSNPVPAADEPALAHRGGGGGGREWSMSLWLTPVPPPGELVIVVAGPELGIEESRLTVDGGALSAAADAVEVLWPHEPPQAHPGLVPVPRDVSPGGWFDRALRRPDADG